MEQDRWGSDAPISAPHPEDDLTVTSAVDLGGFIFTPHGIRLPVTTALHEQRYAPTWAPQAGRRDGEG